MRSTLIAAVFLVASLVWMLLASGTDSQALSSINSAIEQGEVSALADYLAPNVDITISNSKTSMPCDDATRFLAEFFKVNKPQAYDSAGGRNCASGSLTTVDGKQYKVDLRLKNINHQLKITGMHFH